MPTARTAQRLVLVAFLVLGLMARLSTAKVPLLDHHSWRQADTASIARNFLEERFNPLYPQVDWRGNAQTGYVETGLELHAFAVAAIARLTGFTSDIGRFLSCAYFAGSLLLLHGFLRARYGVSSALWGAAAYSFGFALPFFMDRTFMNEPMLLLLSFAAYRSAQLAAGGSARGTSALLASTTLMTLVKPVYLVAWAGVLAVYWEHDGRRISKRWELPAILAVNAATLWLWTHHARALAEATGLSFGLEDKLFDAQVLLSLSFWRTIGTRLTLDVFGPVGAALALVGLAGGVRERRWFEAAGLAGFVAYLVVVTRGNLVHDYYQMVAVPVGSVLVGRGTHLVASAWARASVDRYLRIGAGLVGLMVVAAFVRSINSWYGVPWEKQHVCAAGRQALGRDTRVVLAGYSNPDLLFCLDRKGWIVPESELTAARLRSLLDAGARAVLVGTDVPAGVLSPLSAPEWTVPVRNRRFRLFAAADGVAHGSTPADRR